MAGAIGLTGMGGYQFGGKIPVVGGDLDFKDDWMYAASIEIPINVKPGSNLYLYWSNQPTQLRLKEPIGTTIITDANLMYFQGGALYDVPSSNPKLNPFTMLTLGVTWFDPTDAAMESKTKFSFMFGGGVKYWASEKMALRLQFNLHMTLINSGVWLGFGGGGGNISVSGSGFLQGTILAGLTFNLGNN
jgi:opacity protein-like surface antigen